MNAFRLSDTCVSIVILLIACTTRNDQTSQLGVLDFSVNGKKEAQPYFKKGLLLLHSFEYEDAAEEFRKAIDIDSNFTMAYWGESMTYNHNLWGFQDYEKANAVLAMLSPNPEQRVVLAKSELEKDFITGINILYGSGSKIERDSIYAAYMGELYKKYPKNNEVASFYSIALLGSVPVGRDIQVYELAAEIAKEVLARNPKHPGALHYLIHAYDDPDHAALALNAANKYSVVATDAGHALHMPTHIYLALGMWDKVISSNIDSWEAGLKRKERKNLNNDALNYHAYHWLEYGYLQDGNKSEAEKLLNEMKRYCEDLNSERAREYLINQKTTFLVETNGYGSEVSNIEVKQDDLSIVTRAMTYFTEGMAAYTMNDAEAMDFIISKLDGERQVEKERITYAGTKMCGGIYSNIPNRLEVQQAEVMELELRAMRAWLKKDTVAAENYLTQAVALERNISFAYGPPTIVKPSFELYGEWLIQVNRPKEAVDQFDLSLKAAPGRLLSVKGRAVAENLANNKLTTPL